QLSAFAAAAVSVPLLNSCTQAITEDAIAKPIFLSRLFDEKQIDETGKAYIQKAPSENDENKLIQLLSDGSSIARSSDQNAIHRYLDQRVKKDFETGNTVVIKGWVLSVTETRQCALFSLLQN
ncbi:MAG TPA: hypothetical protein VN958_01605, partial [Chitinophagaceae bacterium]|nr:hypothetical protein [Chitinophagaceae bacterium]